MTYEVILSQTSVETYEAIYEQIKHKFGQSAADKFEVKVFQILDLLIETPFIFKSALENVAIRKGLVHPNCSFFYNVTGNEVNILFFWDNRQEPILD